MPKVPVVLIDLLISESICVLLEFGDRRSALEYFLRMPVHAVESRCDVCANELLYYTAAWVLGYKCFYIIPVAVHRDDCVLAVILFVGLRNFWQSVTHFFELRDVVLNGLPILRLFYVFKLVFVGVPEERVVREAEDDNEQQVNYARLR